MKSGFAAMIAVRGAAPVRLPQRGQVVLTVASDEKTGSPFGTRLLLKRGVRANRGIVSEPTDLETATAPLGQRMIPGESSELVERDPVSWRGSLDPVSAPRLQVVRNYEPYVIVEDPLPSGALI